MGWGDYLTNVINYYYLSTARLRLKKGSVYFTAKILAATDQLELLCRQLNIRSRGMMQYKEKGHFVKNMLCCLWCNG